MKTIEGGVTAPKDYLVGSVAAGIKKKKKDMTVLVSKTPASVAGAFTTNVVKAAPVTWDQKIVSLKAPVRALVVNSGNANACTGEQGERDVQAMANRVGSKLGIADESILVCSTGVIGVPLPMDKILVGIDNCLANLDNNVQSGVDASEAILTTDTFTKSLAVEIEIDGVSIRIGGMAKGSGMIHPNMATMLSFITTDADIDSEFLQDMLGHTVLDSYNMISVDGDTSTNDTVLVFANGAAQGEKILPGTPGASVFEEAFSYVHTELAKMIVMDGEGAGKFIEVSVTGAPTKEDARLMARSVISSNLVKTAFFGADANWGRMLCAMGYSGADFDPGRVSITYMSEKGMIAVMKEGVPVAFDEDLAKRILQEKVVHVAAQVGTGDGDAMAWGCDLSYEYVRINGDYRS
ncbi:bifunctional glutamate N-acetyltransferase/amino-acid acetyltransferase ArgJ [Pleomorphochaeta sp. DL1XJH-081]|uniref:bifunctional glutamate N-acetyltransferase/amino-acid acetyltransferase ArgJ n=1 Tax=Pleomorphochaeta sp. DL1XJH-081 TaxID=3409690 RepID=UPI003BB78B3F